MPARIDAGRGGIAAPNSGGVIVRGAGGGEALASVGRSLANFAEPQLAQMKRERAEEEAAADRIAVAQASSQARLDWQTRLNEDLGRYDGSEPGFADGVVRRYQEDARSRLEALPPRIRKAVELDLVQFGERLTSAAIEGESGKRQAWTMKGLISTFDAEAMRLLDRPDDLPGALEGLQRLAEAAPPALREKFLEDGRRVLTSTYAEAMLRDDPAGLLAELTDGLLDGLLDTPGKARLTAQAQAGVDREISAAEAARKQELARRTSEAKALATRVVAFYNAGLAPDPDLLAAAYDAALGLADEGSIERMKLAEYRMRRSGTGGGRKTTDRLNLIEKVLGQGLVPNPELIAAARAEVEAAGAETLAARFNRIFETAELRQEAAFMPRAELEARIEALRSGAVGESEFAAFDALSRVKAARDKMGGSDNIGWAVANGARIAPLDPSDESFAAGLVRRSTEADALASMTGEPFQMFSKAEREKIADHLDKLPPSDRAAFLGQITAASGERAGAAIREISEKRPGLARAGLLTATGRGKTALEALRGEDLLKGDKTLLPGSKTALDLLDAELLRGVVPENQQAVRAGIVETARGLYAVEAQRRGLTGQDFDEKAYRRALQRAAGQMGDTGGIQKVGRDRIWLPPHMTKEDVARTLNHMTGEEWAAFSLSGDSVPSEIAEDGTMAAVSLRQLFRSRLVSVGEGRYQVSLTDPKAGALYVLDSNSPPDDPRPYVLDLTRVSPAAVRARRGATEALDAARRRGDAVAPDAMREAQESDVYRSYLDGRERRRDAMTDAHRDAWERGRRLTGEDE